MSETSGVFLPWRMLSGEMLRRSKSICASCMTFLLAYRARANPRAWVRAGSSALVRAAGAGFFGVGFLDRRDRENRGGLGQRRSGLHDPPAPLGGVGVN